DHELRCDALGLREEPRALALLEVAVEVAREDALELTVGERQRERVAVDELRARCLPACDGEHSLALIEPDDVAAQMSGEEAGSARHVERSRGWQRLDQLREHVEL